VKTLLRLFSGFIFCMSFSAHADIEVSTQSLELLFSDQGALRSATACFPSCDAQQSLRQDFSGRRVLVDFDLAEPGGETDNPEIQQTERDGVTLLCFRFPADGRELSWHIPAQGWKLELQTREINSLRVRSGATFRPRAADGFGRALERVRYLWFTTSDIEAIELDDVEAKAFVAASWSGFRNRFWTVMLHADEALDVTPETDLFLQDASVSWNLAAKLENSLSLYLGPVEPAALKSAGQGLGGMMYSALWFWLRWICQFLFLLLNWIHSVVPVWGPAIMILSLSVNVLMRPLSKRADRLQDRVQATESRLAPKMKEIRQRFKGEVQAAKILEMYRSEGVHPLYSLKSLAGIALVIPVFIGAFDMLAENIHLAGQGFVWIADLSHPDALARLPFTIPFFGSNLNLLPFIMMVLSVWASAIHRPIAVDGGQHRKQVLKLVLMALIFFALFYTFPAGMVLYWTTNNLISVIKNLYRRQHKKTP
jgi:YidC/Oxa1 family membrane protein insertase